MPNLLARGQRLLARLMPESASPAGAISYLRTAGGDPIDMSGLMWLGRSVFTRVPDEGGSAKIWGDRDYFCFVADLPVIPERGDRIVEVIDGQEVTFELMDQYGEPAQRFGDPGRQFYRMHTKQV